VTIRPEKSAEVIVGVSRLTEGPNIKTGKEPSLSMREAEPEKTIETSEVDL
jgi:hypothetical protein